MNTKFSEVSLAEHNLAKLECELAWALAAAVSRRLTSVQRDAIYVTIGAGDTYAAIQQLIPAVVHNGVALAVDDIRRLEAWVDGYRGHVDEQRLRLVVSRIAYQRPATSSRSIPARRRYLRTTRAYRQRRAQASDHSD